MLRNVAVPLLSALLSIPLSAQNVSFSSHSFTAPAVFAVHGDFNNDGREDFVFSKPVSPTGSTYGVQPLVSTADGSYKAGSTYTFPYPQQPIDFALGDFN